MTREKLFVLENLMFMLKKTTRKTVSNVIEKIGGAWHTLSCTYIQMMPSWQL